MVTRPRSEEGSTAALRQRLGYVPPRTPSVAAGGGLEVDAGGELSLEMTAVTAGVYGDSTKVAAFDVDDYGRLVDASEVSIAFPVPSVTFGTGAPGGTPEDGALYFDDTGSPYVGYVGRAGVWQQFS